MSLEVHSTDRGVGIENCVCVFVFVALKGQSSKNESYDWLDR